MSVVGLTSKPSFDWNQEQEWERQWHSNCVNTINEERKQLVYANKMGLGLCHNDKTPYNIDMNGSSVIDIGGGPVSLLLKCSNVKGTVIDPCNYPDWVLQRYKEAGIAYFKIKGEELNKSGSNEKDPWDEAWIYNCLQHTIDPAKILINAKNSAKIIRIFEWLDTELIDGHPHTFTEAFFTDTLGPGAYSVEILGDEGCYGKCIAGIWKGSNW